MVSSFNDFHFIMFSTELTEGWSLKKEKKEWDWAFTFLGQIIRVWLEECVIDALAEEYCQRSWLILMMLRERDSCMN